MIKESDEYFINQLIANINKVNIVLVECSFYKDFQFLINQILIKTGVSNSEFKLPRQNQLIIGNTKFIFTLIDEAWKIVGFKFDKKFTYFHY